MVIRKEEIFTLNIRNKFFTQQLAPNKLLSEDVVAPSLEAFKASLDGALSNMIQ